ncbi:hypothetical protein HDU93_004840 [Gonapodya sp. JEL0774]|nr:hypothetical protein HDU93_004840 [Gonapodya sp. JEL0774]
MDGSYLTDETQLMGLVHQLVEINAAAAALSAAESARRGNTSFDLPSEMDEANLNGENGEAENGITLGNGEPYDETGADAVDSLAVAVSEDFQMSQIIKTVFRNGRQEAFLGQLELFIARKESEIERVCNFHFEEFAQAVEQLLKIRFDASRLKSTIAELNSQLQESGAKLLETTKLLSSQHRTLLNIDSASEALRSCLRLLERANKVFIQIDNRRFYAALKGLEELEQGVAISSSSGGSGGDKGANKLANLSFVKYLEESIPILRERIREAVTKETKDWLVHVRELSRKVGRLAMEQTAYRQARVHAAMTGGAAAQQGADGENQPPQRRKVSLSVELVLNEANEENLVDNTTVRIDFRPLYQGLHIHTTLGLRDQFKVQYESDRRAQLDLVLTSHFNLRGVEDMVGFEGFLWDVVGFFVVESVVGETGGGLRTRAAIEKLWESAVTSILSITSSNLQDCGSPDLFLEIKLLLITFIQTLEGYDYNVERLYELMGGLFARYAELMKVGASERIRLIVEMDDFSPMIIDNPTQYEQLPRSLRLSPIAKSGPGGASAALRNVFPRTLPFSKGVFQVCDIVRKFINGYYRFAEGFMHQYGAMDDLLKDSLEILLSTHVSQAILTKVADSQNLTLVVQTLTNLDFLESATTDFEDFLMEKRISHNKGGRVSLQSKKVFQDTHKQVEKRVFELMNEKIDDFLEVAEYDWLTSSVATKPSPYLYDLVNYLTTINSSVLSSCPPQIKSFIYFDAFDHLSRNLENMLLKPEVRKISPQAIENFHQDIMFLESFVEKLADPNVLDTFQEVRQEINFLRSDALEEYLNPSIRNRKYGRIKEQKIFVLLEKIRPDSSMFSSLMSKKKETPAETARRTAVDNVLKAMRSAPRDSRESGGSMDIPRSSTPLSTKPPTSVVSTSSVSLGGAVLGKARRTGGGGS